MNFEEIIYEKQNGVARIAINRPHKFNACTSLTLLELNKALTDAWVDNSVGVVVFTGTGEKAFCTGGDQSIRDKGGYAGTIAALPVEVGWQTVSSLIRTIPKPVIARVNGYAIGGGHVFQVVCDLSIAAETAKLGQAGPKVGSFDPGYGTGDLVRCVGLKKAKEIWYMCRLYTAREALDMGLVNAVVPFENDNVGQANLEKLRAGEIPRGEQSVIGWSKESVYRERQVELAVQLFQLMGIERHDKEKRTRWSEGGFRFFGAPAAIIVLTDTSLKPDTPLIDIGIVIQSICLAALAFDLATCIEDQGCLFPDVLRQLAGIPETKRIVMSIAIGYPDWDYPANQVRTSRVPIDDIIQWHGF